MDLPAADQAAPGRSGAPAGPRPAALDRAFVRATVLTGAGAVVLGVLGTFGTRRWGEVPFSVPAPPWYLSWPYYIFWSPRLDLSWALAALPVAVLAVAAALALARAEVAGPVRLAGWVGCTAVLALAVATLRGGPAEWRAPLAYQGEYPDAVDQVGAIPAFLGEFAASVPGLPDFVAQHPPGATVFYLLVDRVWSGVGAAALATTAAAALGVLVVAGLAADELGEAGGRWAAVCWLAGPLAVLYVATTADAMWAPVLAEGALAAHRGLERRSWPWTAAGGVLLWAASMMTFAAVLVLPFLAVRALARLRAERAWVLAWAAGTTVVVAGLAALCWLATGYDPFAAVAAVNRFWSVAPGTNRIYWIWVLGDLLAFTGMVGFPLAAGLLVGTWRALRERAWGSFEVGTLACLLAGALWGHTKGEVERMWQFLVPFAVVVAVRQLRHWRVPLPLVAALLLAQAVAVQVLFFTRW
jgi:methylthioxylose transferase